MTCEDIEYYDDLFRILIRAVRRLQEEVRPVRRLQVEVKHLGTVYQGVALEMSDLKGLADELVVDAGNVEARLDADEAKEAADADQLKQNADLIQANADAIAALQAQVAAGQTIDPAVIAEFQAVHDRLVAKLSPPTP